MWGTLGLSLQSENGKEQKVQKATWMGGTNPGLPAPTCTRACHSAACCPRSGEACDHQGSGSMLWGGTQISRGLSTDCRGRYGDRLFPDPSTWCLPDSGTDTRPSRGQGTIRLCWALPAGNHGQMVRRLVQAMMHLLSATLPAFCAPALPWPRHPCPGLVGHGPGPTLSEPESPHFSPSPCRGSWSVT